MTYYHAFTFNFVGEQTYLLWDDTLEACIIDPGCFGLEEEKVLADFIEDRKLRPVRALCTHLHFDHYLGASFVEKRWGISLEAPALEIEALPSLEDQLKLFGLGHLTVETPTLKPLHSKERLSFGETELEIRVVPGHSPGHLVFYEKTGGLLFSGDTLFNQGIGRTDLWDGDYTTLIQAIRTQILPLPDHTIVLPGHGPSTTVGDEKVNNPYL